MLDAWTRTAVFPGGDIPNIDFESFLRTMQENHPHIKSDVLRHLARSYGTCSNEIIKPSAPIKVSSVRNSFEQYVLNAYAFADSINSTTDSCISHFTEFMIISKL